MNELLNQTETNTELQKLFEGRFKPVFEALRSRTRNSTELETASLVGDVKIAGAAPYVVSKLVFDFFKELAGLKLGRLLVGRRGKPTRFVWDVPMLDVAAAATGASQVKVPSRNGTASLMPKRTSTLSDMVSFQFLLRPGLVVQLDLPPDFSQSEADRLCKFIQALPLDQQTKA